MPTYCYSTKAVVWSCSVEKGVLRNFAKFTGNTCAGVSFSIKLPAACSFITKETPAQVFSSKFCKIFKNTYFEELEIGGIGEEHCLKQIWHIYLGLKCLGLR